jgi:glutathione S-transferase
MGEPFSKQCVWRFLELLCTNQSGGPAVKQAASSMGWLQLDQHLRSRMFVVGQSLSLADLVLFSAVQEAVVR